MAHFDFDFALFCLLRQRQLNPFKTRVNFFNIFKADLATIYPNSQLKHATRSLQPSLTWGAGGRDFAEGLVGTACNRLGTRQRESVRAGEGDDFTELVSAGARPEDVVGYDG